MYLLGIGIVLLLMKYLAIGPVAGWSWWLVLAPFALAVVWWTWADLSGYSKKKAMQKMDQRKADRIEKSRVALGLGTRKGTSKRR
ncbi:MAG: TIGR04438 family Trp-rich protein [Burkholderiaceae bacterium]|nr:TIGR04438 family Trp-rich protein [Burkholderiales bacterium]TAL64043.1 MAG: TIGR04438 family Trp-rich protein [Burkholderiaceae bacterium]TBR76378.1 MAG: TIGR04438 family Trp-rich protein [Burkholderiaceae bacterium]